MRLLILFTLPFILLSTKSNAQVVDSTKVFEHAHGLLNGGISFVESEGYQVFREFMEVGMDTKGKKKIKKKYKLSKEVLPTASSVFPDAVIFKSHDTVGGDTLSLRTYYCFESGENLVEIIGLHTSSSALLEVEEILVRSLQNKSFPDGVFTSTRVDSIFFAGRYIPLGPICQWRGAHNIQCPDMGQMNWSEFTHKERAEEMIAAQRRANVSKGLINPKASETIKVRFEGVETTAIRAELKVQLPKLLMGGSNVLIVYYVVCELRGRFVACTLSHYANESGLRSLPPLLSEVMELLE